MKPFDTDVVVVGAGFCGLSAASELVKAGLSVVVLEARDRVGGRVESQMLPSGERIDTGGQFFCDDMPEVLAMARCHGKTRVEAPVEGEFRMQPILDADRANRIYGQSAVIRDRMNAIDPDDPAIAGLTVEDWLGRQADPPAAKAAFRSTVEGLWCRPVGAVPLWHLIENDRRITNTQSELQYFLAETMQSLAEGLASGLNGRIRLGTLVQKIGHDRTGVRVLTPAGTLTARRVLVAVPPVMASRLTYDPPLPSALSNALGAWASGSVVKMIIRYDRPFWRDAGLNGMVMWQELPGLFACDVSVSDDRAALVVFAGGPLADDWSRRDEKELRRQVVKKLVGALGPQAAGFTAFVLRNWTDDRWSGGGYSDVLTNGAPRNAEAMIRVGAPPVHFAASELSPSFPGYIEGAIIAGRMAAAELVAGLSDAA